MEAATKEVTSTLQTLKNIRKTVSTFYSNCSKSVQILDNEKAKEHIVDFSNKSGVLELSLSLTMKLIEQKKKLKEKIESLKQENKLLKEENEKLRFNKEKAGGYEIDAQMEKYTSALSIVLLHFFLNFEIF